MSFFISKFGVAEEILQCSEMAESSLQSSSIIENDKRIDFPSTIWTLYAFFCF